MLITDFDYDLPLELIAQYPEEKRDEARLLVVDRQKDAVYHRKFYDILDYLQPGDCLVMNDSRVLPARLFGRKRDTGAKAEFLLVKRKNGVRWEAMVKPGKKRSRAVRWISARTRADGFPRTFSISAKTARESWSFLMTAFFTTDWKKTATFLCRHTSTEKMRRWTGRCIRRFTAEKTARWPLLRQDSTLRKSCCRECGKRGFGRPM